jgi:hypothetical protein
VRALVVADHIDVVGYYPCKDERDNGFLSSGAKFRDPEFNQLNAAIAQAIDFSIRTSAQVPAPATTTGVGSS